MKNRLDAQNINVIYCPTGEILTDFYAKPLQVNLFRKFRDLIMGLRHVSSLKRETTIVEQEHIENNGTSGLSQTIKIEMNKTVTTDVSRSANVNKFNSDISRIEINHGRDGECFL